MRANHRNRGLDRGAALHVHRDQFRRQGGHLDCRCPNDARARTRPTPVRVGRFRLFLLFAVSSVATGFLVNRVQTRGCCWRWASSGR
jgi:hypothetical protein